MSAAREHSAEELKTHAGSPRERSTELRERLEHPTHLRLGNLVAIDPGRALTPATLDSRHIGRYTRCSLTMSSWSGEARDLFDCSRSAAILSASHAVQRSITRLAELIIAKRSATVGSHRWCRRQPCKLSNNSCALDLPIVGAGLASRGSSDTAMPSARPRNSASSSTTLSSSHLAERLDTPVITADEQVHRQRQRFVAID